MILNICINYRELFSDHQETGESDIVTNIRCCSKQYVASHPLEGLQSWSGHRENTSSAEDRSKIVGLFEAIQHILREK